MLTQNRNQVSYQTQLSLVLLAIDFRQKNSSNIKILKKLKYRFNSHHRSISHCKYYYLHTYSCMNGIEKIKNGFPRAHILSTTYLRYVARQGLGRVNASPKFRPLGQVINFAFTSSKEINWVGKVSPKGQTHHISMYQLLSFDPFVIVSSHKLSIHFIKRMDGFVQIR